MTEATHWPASMRRKHSLGDEATIFYNVNERLQMSDEIYCLFLADDYLIRRYADQAEGRTSPCAAFAGELAPHDGYEDPRTTLWLSAGEIYYAMISSTIGVFRCANRHVDG